MGFQSVKIYNSESNLLTDVIARIINIAFLIFDIFPSYIFKLFDDSEDK
jgi:hypothetical protein